MSVNYQVFSGGFFKTFKEMTNRVNYLKELGISNVWFTPIFDSPTYHGYDTRNYFKLSKNYGDKKDFIEMCEKLRESNIQITLDLVLCHTSEEHEWFKLAKENKEPYVDYYIWADEPKPIEEFSDNLDQSAANLYKWSYCEERNQYYFSPFCKEMPALNLDNITLRKEIESIVRYWLQFVDNFRLDAVIHSHYDKNKSLEFWNWFRILCRSIKPSCKLIGEAWTSVESMGEWSNVLGGCFNFETSNNIINHVNSGNIRDLSFIIKQTNDKIKHFRHMDNLFLSNHDQDRSLFTLKNDLNRAKIASAFLLTMKGTPWIYYGEEIGMSSSKIEGDIHVRQEMDFNEAYRQSLDTNSLFNHYKSLIKVRNSSMALKYGNLVPCYSNSSQCGVFLRTFYDEKVYVIINNKEKSVPMIAHEKYEVLYSSNDSLHEIITYKGQGLETGIYVLKML